MKYLIIGITSLFGPVIYRKLKEDDSNIQIITTGLEGEKVPAFLAGASEDAGKTGDYFVLDLLDRDKTEQFIRNHKPDVILNLAVQNSVGFAWSNPQDTIDVNVNGTLNLLDAVRAVGDGYRPRIVIAGSGEEYGELPFSELPIKEDTKVNPRNIFAASKACQTMMAKLYIRAYKMDIIILRTFNEIGPGQSERFAVSNFCKQFALLERSAGESAEAASDENDNKSRIPVIKTGNLNIRRDFTDVRDLADAFILAARKGKSGEVYNAGHGNCVPIQTVLEMLQDITGIKVKIEADAARIRPIDPAAFESDNRKLQKDTGWKPQIELIDTITDMLDFWRENI